VAGLIRNIRKALPAINSREELERSLTCLHMSDWHSQPDRIPEEFQIVHEAQQSGNRLQIVYASAGKADHARTVRVRNIFQLGMKFYMNAYCERVQAERTFRLDRIRSAELVSGESIADNE
jgi:predicted DNA-binding transcriptional regulator YafY